MPRERKDQRVAPETVAGDLMTWPYSVSPALIISDTLNADNVILTLHADYGVSTMVPSFEDVIVCRAPTDPV